MSDRPPISITDEALAEFFGDRPDLPEPHHLVLTVCGHCGKTPDELQREEISRIAAAMNGRIQPSEVQLGHDLMIPAARLYAAGIRVVQPAPERVHPKGCLGHDRAGNCVDRNAEIIATEAHRG